MAIQAMCSKRICIYIALVLVSVLVLFIPFVSLTNISDGDIIGQKYCVLLFTSTAVVLLSFILLKNKHTVKIRLRIQEVLFFACILIIPVGFGQEAGYELLTPVYLCVLLICLKHILVVQNSGVFILIILVLVISIIESALGIFQTGRLIFNRLELAGISGSLKNPGVYANFLVPVFIFSLGLFMYVKPKYQLHALFRYLAIITAFTIAIVLPFTRARIAWIACAVGFGFLIWPFFKGNTLMRCLLLKSIQRKVAAVTILMAAAFVLGVLLYNYKPQSAQGHLLIYEVCLDAIKDKPLFGHGYGSFAAVYPNYQANYFSAQPESDKMWLADNVKTAFNEFLQAGFELGLVGLTLFILFVVHLFRAETKPDWESVVIPAKGSLVGALVCCMFSYPLRVLPVALNIIIFVAIILAGSKSGNYQLSINKWIYKPILALIIIGTIYLVHIQYIDYQARVQWKKAIDLVEVDLNKAIPYYEQAYHVLKYDGFFLYNYGAELLELNPKKGTKILEEATQYSADNNLYVYLGDGYKMLKKYKNAEDCYLHSSFMVPCKFYPRYQLFKLYCQTNQKEKALMTAKAISKLKVKIPSMTVTAIKIEIEQWLKEKL